MLALKVLNFAYTKRHIVLGPSYLQQHKHPQIILKLPVILGSLRDFTLVCHDIKNYMYSNIF